MKDRRTKIILYTLLIFIMNIAVVGYLYSKESLNDAINEYQIDNKIIENNFDVRKDISDMQIASATDFEIWVSGDLIKLNYGPAGSFTFMKDVNNYNSAKNITTIGGVKSGANGYVSLPNGSYYIYTYNVSNMAKIAKGPINVTKSCNDESKTNQTGSFTLERCYIKTASGLSPNVAENLHVCASGYTLKQTNLNRSDCDNKKLEYGMTRRYCKVIYSLTCEKQGGSDPTPPPSVPDARLASLSVNTGSLSPAFKNSTFKYTVNVDSSVSSIQVNASPASGSSFVAGAGPRTVNLNYGANTIKVKVQNSNGKATTYTITVNRPDSRSTVNTLSNLKTSDGVLSPAFASNVTNYSIDVPNSTSVITLDATLTDGNSSFVAGFGPSSYSLEPGPNKIYIKVSSQKGDVNVYNITVNRETTPSECTTNTEELALLKQLDLEVDIPNIELDQIEDFDPKLFSYDEVIKLPSQVTSINVKPYVQTDGDTFTIEGTENLEIGESRTITITVTSKNCPNYSNVYTFRVERQPEVNITYNPELKSLTIADHDEFKFEPNVENYNLVLHKGEDKLSISYTKAQEETHCEEYGNENLQYGSVVTIRCTSPDEDITPMDYNITIDGVDKGTNIVIIVILVIIIIIVLIYLVLRLLGYRIYFNFSVFGAFFRGLGEKFNNMFDK